MADYITAIRTGSGDKQIDYQSLANKDHASQHGTSGSDPITPSIIGAAEINHTHTAESLGIQAIVEQVMQESGSAKVAVGSYVGTGTYGASNPCSLTFDNLPTKKAVNL